MIGKTKSGTGHGSWVQFPHKAVAVIRSTQKHDATGPKPSGKALLQRAMPFMR